MAQVGTSDGVASPKSGGRPALWRWPFSPWVLALLPPFLTFLLYRPVLDHDFVNWDDAFYIQNNLHIRHFDLASLKWMVTSDWMGYWMPVTWFSLTLDHRLGGSDPFLYHFQNLLLHCLNTGLVFFLALKLFALTRTDRSQVPWALPAAFSAALLFGIHPLHVEVTAWVTERKDLLCGAFFFSALWMYLDGAARKEGKVGRCLTCLGFFIAAVLSKPIAVTLPFILILLDHWPLQRLRLRSSDYWLGKMPFFLVMALFGGATLLFRAQSGVAPTLQELPASFRIMNAFHSLIFYLEKSLYPTDLAAFYPIYLKSTFSAGYLFAGALVVLVVAICFWQRRRYPFLTVASLYYLILLAPVLGVLQAGSHAAADRYAYLPCLGPFLLLVAFIFSRKGVSRNAVLLMGAGWLAFLAITTARQVPRWKDSVALWENVLKVNPRNSKVAFSNLAEAYQRAGRIPEALKAYDFAIAKAPPLTYPHHGRGEIFLDLGRLEEAAGEFRTSISLDPGYVSPRNNLAKALRLLRKSAEAEREVREAIRIDPYFTEAYSTLALIQADRGGYKQAIATLARALSLDPQSQASLRALTLVMEGMKGKKRSGVH